MYIDKGTHFGTPVAFSVERRNDGTYHGTIRVGGPHIRNRQMYAIMEGTLKTGGSQEAVSAALEADLADMIADATREQSND